jgi:uncharacterized protein (DUF1778 family)
MKRTSIIIYINEGDKKLIEIASKKFSLTLSSFCRSSAIKEAKKIIEVKRDADQGNK